MQFLLLTFASPGPELFKLGPFVLRWYGFLIACSVLIGLNLSTYLAKKRGLRKDIINDLLPILVLSAVIGARIYYVAFQWFNYKKNWLEIFAIWKGGIAIHGALLAGTIAVVLFCKWEKQPLWDVIDVLVPSVALGQGIGRWGNFFNNEAFGIPTQLPWKLSIPLGYRPEEFISYQFFHPTFLYESVWNFSIFAILLFLFFKIDKSSSNKTPSGVLSCMYILLYSMGRIWIEGLRVDPLCLGGYPPFCEGGIRIAQLISFLLLSIGAFGLFRVVMQKKKLPELSE